MRMCNCVRTDCENCPMRQTGTSGPAYEYAKLHNKWPFETETEINETSIKVIYKDKKENKNDMERIKYY